MSTPWPEIRRLIAVNLFDPWRSRTTAAGTTTTLVDTRLQRISEQTDGLDNGYFLILDGPAAGEWFKVKTTSGYTPSTGTATSPDALPAAPGIGASYEFHRHHPVDVYQAAIHSAIRQLSDILWVEHTEYLVVDDLLAANAGYEVFLESLFPNWTLAGAGATVARERTRVWGKGQSALITAGGGAAATLTQNGFSRINIRELASKGLEFKRWVWASAGSTVRLGVSFTGTPSYGSYHDGDATWRLLTSNVQNYLSTATELVPTIQVAAAGAPYVDGGGGSGLFCTGYQLDRYPIPDRFIKAPYRVEMQEYEEYPEGPYFPLSRRNPPASRRGLRLVGRGYLTMPQVETDVIEVEGSQLELLVAQATEIAWGLVPPDELAAQKRAEWAQKAQALQARPGMTRLGRGGFKREGWSISEDGKFLILER